MILNYYMPSSWLLASVPVGIFSFKLRFEDEKNLSAEKREWLEDKVKDLSERLGVTKKLEIVETSNFPLIAQAMGNSLFPGKAGIYIDTQRRVKEGQLEFLLAHEISHIKNNDYLTMAACGAAVGIITMLALSLLFPQWAIFVPALSGSPASILAYLVGGATCLIFSRWREECADKLAFSVCSDEGKKGSYKLFEKIQKKQKAYRNESGLDYTSSLWRKIKVDHEGNSRLDLLHPPLSYRVRYLKEAYKENSWV